MNAFPHVLILIALINGAPVPTTVDFPNAVACRDALWYIRRTPPANMQIAYCALPGRVL